MIQMSAAANSATPTNSRTRRDTVDPFTWSNLHDHRQHERPPARTLLEEAAQLDAQLLFDDSRISTFLEARPFHGVDQDARAVGEQFLGVFHDEAARDDVGDPL